MWRKLTPDDIYKLREKNIIISNCLWHYEENGLSWEQALFQTIIRLDKALHEAVADSPNTIDQLNSTTNMKDFHAD